MFAGLQLLTNGTFIFFDWAEPLKEAGGDQNRRWEEKNHTSLHRTARHGVTKAHKNTSKIITHLNHSIRSVSECLFLLPRDFSPALFNSVPILPGSSASTQLTSQISSDSNTANSLGLRPSHDPTATSPNKTVEDNKDR